ncbi:ferritin-like domain-containing protein [Paraburkholderia humisilvae]|uniref:ferritin-like domain-containing protein n=1 Tax=Paraburkholderia humisilvae TaxID=627669 RepID=UPI0035EB8497
MPGAIDSKKPFGKLFCNLDDDVNALGADAPRKRLQQAAQLAIQVEFTTIPPYLTALYSIVDVSSRAYQLLRSVVMEEMFHVNQAANLLVAIGGQPRFTGNTAPAYPCYLPHANPKRTPYIGLCPASPEVFENTFAAIEAPAPPHAPAQDEQYDTIAQLYEFLSDGIIRYRRATLGPPLFDQSPRARQRTDIYLGKFGGKSMVVHDVATALAGIDQIVQQGEGSVPVGQAMIAASQWGTYNHFGDRVDGTYGPIIGTPYEMSHFRKFRLVALDVVNFPATYPITSNPKRSDFSNEVALRLVETFDVAYSIMLDALEGSFVALSHQPGEAPDPFFAQTLPLMHHVMPKLARGLMQTPMYSDGDSAVGPNAAPTYLYQTGCDALAFKRQHTKAREAAIKATDRTRRDELMAMLDDVQNYTAELISLQHSVSQANY